jgi:hypothetical protein
MRKEQAMKFSARANFHLTIRQKKTGTRLETGAGLSFF